MSPLLAQILKQSEQLSLEDRQKLIQQLSESLQDEPLIRETKYPLRGMPITISDDFDEPLPDLWDAFSR